MITTVTTHHSTEETSALYSTYTPESVYMDIETTGLSARFSRIYLVGCLYMEEGIFKTIQWMTENPSDEYELLFGLVKWLEGRDCLVHYNGSSFDVPFLKNRASSFGLVFPALKQLDIMRRLTPYKRAFGFTDMKLKSVEKRLGLNRLDLYSGKELIDDYLAFEQHPTDEIRERLLLHNKEDLTGLLHLLPLFKQMEHHDRFLDVNEGLEDFTASASSSAVRYEFTANYLPENIADAQMTDINIVIKKSGECFEVSLILPLYKGELKHYLTPVKDYRYIPKEDNAYHKSAVKFLDGATCEPATKDTAYLRKTDTFLHLPYDIELSYDKYSHAAGDGNCYLRLKDLESLKAHEQMVKLLVVRLCDKKMNVWTQTQNGTP